MTSRLVSRSLREVEAVFGCNSVAADKLSSGPSPSQAIGPSFGKGADAHPERSRQAKVRTYLFAISEPSRDDGIAGRGRGRLHVNGSFRSTGADPWHQ